MRVIDAFAEPIIKAAVDRKKERDAAGTGLGMKDITAGREKEEIDDDETLLGHLVNYTEGEP